MQPYQAWRRGLISYETFLAKQLENEITTDATVGSPIDHGDYEMVIDNAISIEGAVTFTANSTGVLISEIGTVSITAAGTLTVN
jgi:hypothetical protein